MCTYTVGSPPKLMPQSAPLLASNNSGGRSESEVKKSRMSELPKSTSHLINASTSLVPRPHLRERVWGRDYVSTVLYSKWGTPEIDASGPTSLLSELPAISIQLLHTNTFTRPSHQLTIPITCIQAFLERERKKPKNSWIQLEIEMRTF